MKKLLLILLIPEIVTCVSFSQNTKTINDLQKLNLKGKVKSLTETEYKTVYKFGEIQGEDIQSKKITLFDNKGNIIGYNEYESNGSLIYKYTYKYDDKGNKTEYNYNGNLYNKWTFKYDDKGNKTENNKYDSNGDLIYTCTYKYDDKGNNIEKDEYDSGGNADYKYTYEYDDKGNMTENTKYDLNRKVYTYIYKYKYDDKGDTTENTKYESDNVYIYTYKYDDKGNMIEGNFYKRNMGSSGFSSSTLVYKFTFKYDDKRNIIESSSPDSDSTSIHKDTFKYDYDKTDNWIKQTIIYTKYYTNGPNNDIQQSITKREITYY